MDDLTPEAAAAEAAAEKPQAVAPQLPSATLSDGRVAVVRKGKGRDLLEATRRAGTDPSRTQFELLCVLTTLDGQPLQLDELMDMELEDVTELMLLFGGKTGDFFPSAATSSTSPR